MLPHYVTDQKVKTVHIFVFAVLTIGCIFFYYFAGTNLYSTSELFRNFAIFELINRLNGSLFFLPFLYISFFVRWNHLIIYWLILVAIAFPRMRAFTWDNAALLQNLFYAAIPIIIVIFVSLEISWRNREAGIWKNIEFERRLHTAQILKTQEAERKLIAQELHDDTLQTLIATASRVQTIVDSDKITDLPEIKREAEWIRDTITGISEDIRQLSIRLRPSVLDNLGLISAIRWLVDKFVAGTSAHAEVHVDGIVRTLGAEIDIVVFRLVQEALSNIRRHAKATQVKVTLKFSDISLHLYVEDNGVGFDMPSSQDLIQHGKIGLIGMQERARSIGSELKIESSENFGTRYLVEINYQK